MFLFFALVAAALGAPGWMAAWLILDALDEPRRRGWCLFFAIVSALLGHPALALVCAVLAYLWGERERERRQKAPPGINLGKPANAILENLIPIAGPPHSVRLMPRQGEETRGGHPGL